MRPFDLCGLLKVMLVNGFPVTPIGNILPRSSFWNRFHGYELSFGVANRCPHHTDQLTVSRIESGGSVIIAESRSRRCHDDQRKDFGINRKLGRGCKFLYKVGRSSVSMCRKGKKHPNDEKQKDAAYHKDDAVREYWQAFTERAFIRSWGIHSFAPYLALNTADLYITIFLKSVKKPRALGARGFSMTFGDSMTERFEPGIPPEFLDALAEVIHDALRCHGEICGDLLQLDFVNQPSSKSTKLF